MHKGTAILELLRKKENRLIIILAAVGLVSLLLSIKGEESVPAVTQEDTLAEMCSLIEGVGECRVLIYYSNGEGEEGEVESVIVICDGAESVAVEKRLTDMLSSFYGIGTHRIKIVKRRS